MTPAPAEPFRPLSLVAGGRTVPFAEGVVAVGDVELAVAVSGAGPGARVDWSVRNPGRSEVRLDEVAILVEGAPARVLEHGWQSWSAVRRCAPGDVRRSRRRTSRRGAAASSSPTPTEWATPWPATSSSSPTAAWPGSSTAAGTSAWWGGSVVLDTPGGWLAAR